MGDAPKEYRELSVTERKRLKMLAFELSEALIQREKTGFEVGRIIDDVITHRLWRHWPECMGKFSSVVDWGWTVLHFKQRKLAYFRSNYLKLSALSVTEATLARAYRIGWTKLVYLLDMCTSEAELVEWIDRVETQNLRDEDLKKTLALHHAKSAQACLPGSTQTIDDASVEIPSKLKRIRWGLMVT